MIQRVQSLFILTVLLGLILGLIFQWPFFVWSENIPEIKGYECMVGEQFKISLLTDMKLFISCLLILLMNLFILFDFKQPKRQFKRLRLSLLMHILNALIVVFTGSSIAKENGLPFNLMSTTPYLWCLIFLFFVQFLALRSVKKDLDLLASADRLR
jgi:amino acid transporter